MKSAGDADRGRRLTATLALQYIRHVASLQRYQSRGRHYYRLVESYRRPDGRPGIRLLEHLGKADDLLARLRASQPTEVRSVAAGAVDAVMRLATAFGVAETLDEAVRIAGGRVQVRDGLTVGQSVLAAAVARLCHPSSKRAVAAWARGTTLPRWLGVDPEVLTSQHFWDQMDAMPTEAIAEAEQRLVQQVVSREALQPGVLAYDTTNFHTHLATTTTRSRLAQRGHNKQRRNDLRQLGLALVVSEDGQVPLGHVLYDGARPDVRTFAALVAPLRRRLQQIVRQPEQLTLVFDQGAESAANLAAWRADDVALAHYVTALKSSAHRAWLATVAAQLAPVTLRSGDTVRAWRGRQAVHGVEQTVVVLWSPQLAEGQRRGLAQQLARAQRALDAVSSHPRGGPEALRRRAARLARGQYLREIVRIELEPAATGGLRGRLLVDEAARERLQTEYFGLRLLTTTRDEWTTAQIIEAYRGQARAERAFRDLKDPWVGAFRPQFHWTDQKLRVHALIALLALLLGRVLLRRAQQATGFVGSQRALVECLGRLRRATLIYQPAGAGRPRVVDQPERCEADVRTVAVALGVLAADAIAPSYIRRSGRK